MATDRRECVRFVALWTSRERLSDNSTEMTTQLDDDCLRRWTNERRERNLEIRDRLFYCRRPHYYIVWSLVCHLLGFVFFFVRNVHVFFEKPTITIVASNNGGPDANFSCGVSRHSCLGRGCNRRVQKRKIGKEMSTHLLGYSRTSSSCVQTLSWFVIRVLSASATPVRSSSLQCASHHHRTETSPAFVSCRQRRRPRKRVTSLASGYSYAEHKHLQPSKEKQYQ